MTLPVIQAIVADVEIPSSKQSIKIRQMLAKEEKVILTAKADSDEENRNSTILKAICQVVQNCIVTPNIDLSKLALFDVEYLFIKLRELSVSNIVESSYRDNEEMMDYAVAMQAWKDSFETAMQEWKDNPKSVGVPPPEKAPQPQEPAAREFKIDLSKVVVKFPENIDKKIKCNNIDIMLKYPEASLYIDPVFLKSEGIDTLNQLVFNSIASVGSMSVWQDEELKTFLDQMPIPSYDKIKEFLSNLPTIYYKIEYKNNKDHERKIELTRLMDFFVF